MKGRLLAVAMLGVIVYAALMSFGVVHAQEEWQQAYTVADPVRENGFGLATQGGRYAISLGDACSDAGIVAGQNVMVIPIRGFTGAAMISADGVSECPIRFEQLMADVPCFTNDDNVCDVAAEQ